MLVTTPKESASKRRRGAVVAGATLISLSLAMGAGTAAVEARPSGASTGSEDRVEGQGAKAPRPRVIGRAPGSGRTVEHPGARPWRQVPARRVGAECGLSRRLLEKAEPEMSLSPYAIFRYGKLCWVGGDPEVGRTQFEIGSATKSFGALLFGRLLAKTDIDEQTLVASVLTAADVAQSDADDPVGLIQRLPPPNPLSTVFHMLTSTGHNPSLTYGTRVPWTYDAVGVRGMNALVPFMDKVVSENPDIFPGSKTALDLAENELFKPLGMTDTGWKGVVVAHTLESNLYDMGKMGLLMLRQGRWGNRQIVDSDYIYRMTHQQIEDVHTGYGYLTWVNADRNVAQLFDIKVDRNCSPFAGWPTYPHAPTFEAPNSNGGAPFQGGHDIGTFWFDGAGGQFIEVHRGLDLVLVTRNDEAAQAQSEESQEIGSENPTTGLEYHRLWRLMRPALVAKDPVYKGDEEAFCKAYRSNQHAPDLVSPWRPGDGFGSPNLGETDMMTTPSIVPVSP